ncbi:hypothetical protein EZV62_007956 [Acer yangbiense]|uniref:non-specific serine/threonine protein kinase n=1 Tax=Acer yangbiense TaxID=1000413 RepID=A0A5C7IC14_9ROSI|nr:hypothetical protein EZV62_007956 [Acer yangbiense]
MQKTVQTLQTIFRKLQLRNVEVKQSSCTDGGWNISKEKILRNITCDCSFTDNTVCHITNIELKRLNILATTIPEEFGDLTFLRELSFQGNGLSGSIPWEIGEIATLEELVLDDNQLQGSLHKNLGKLSNLRRFLLSANNFSGSIPESFGNLKNLTAFRIDGSNLTGKIPDFIGNWTKLKILDLQGTSMKGPIPSSISLLTNLEELRISDLTGTRSKFPNLKDMKMMERLVLRNCLITDRIPSYIAEMKSLKLFFLTNNNLTGAIPNWILTSKRNMDLSYNSFISPPRVSCLQPDVNLVSSSSSSPNKSIPWCLMKGLPCPEEAKYHSLFINCGGNNITVEGKNYEADLNTKGQSNFAPIETRWAYSSTGVYMGKEDANSLATNEFGLNVAGADYYKTARLSPESLKYYGLCMRKGSYKVMLHFAEIMFTNDQTFASHGRRIFDVSIQGKLVLKDFNIAEEAGGVGIGITKEFNDVWVNGSTLEIHLYWAGKGTSSIPEKGVYGPLISAITVTPNFEVDTGGLSAGAIVGIVVASCAAVALLLVLLWMKGCFGGKDLENIELRALDLQTDVLLNLGGMFAYVLQEQGNLLELVDPSLGSKFSKEEALGMLNIALLCTNPSPTLRPSMSSVVSMLEGKVPVQAPIIMQGSDNQDARFKAFEILSQNSQTRVTTFSQENQSQSSMSMDGPWKDSSVSLQTTDETREYSSASKLLDKDLYDVNLL